MPYSLKPFQKRTFIGFKLPNIILFDDIYWKMSCQFTSHTCLFIFLKNKIQVYGKYKMKIIYHLFFNICCVLFVLFFRWLSSRYIFFLILNLIMHSYGEGGCNNWEKKVRSKLISWQSWRKIHSSHIWLEFLYWKVKVGGHKKNM